MASKIIRKYPKLRNSARGEEYTLQIFPYCNGNPENVVLCHLPSGSGMGQKSPDWFAVYGCSDCHDIIDGRNTDGACEMSFEMEGLMRMALFRTWTRMIEKGLIKI